MSALAQLEGIAEPTEVAGTLDEQAVPERRVVREPAEAAPGQDRRVAAGILGGMAASYGLFGTLIYLTLSY